MGSADRKERHKNDLREKILRVSAGLVLREGLAALTLRRVAAEIEYSPGAIYLYFGSRDEIVRELGRMGLETLLGYLERSAAVQPVRERLRSLGREYVRFAAEHEATYRLIFMLDSATADAVFARVGDKSGAGELAFAALVDGFVRLREGEPGFAHVEPRRAAELYWTSLHGIASLKLACAKFLQTPVEALVDTNLELHWRAWQAGAWPE